MFKKILAWFTGDKTDGTNSCTEEVTVEVKAPVVVTTTVADKIKQTVNDQITDAVTQAKPKKTASRKKKPNVNKQRNKH